MKRTLILSSFVLTLFLAAASWLTAQASAPAQQQTFATPTPLPDGRIIYLVKEGDNCFTISAIFGIPEAQLRSLNRLGEDCALSIGQELLLGIGGPAAAPTTEGPAVTPTVSIPTATPPAGEASVCVVLYEDLNGDALHQDTENLIAGGALNVTGTSGQFSQTTATTAGPDPVCFDTVPEGTYNISVAAPAGYNPTTQLNYTINIKAGDQVYIDFGAQRAVVASPAEKTQENNSGSIFGIAGSVFVLLGLGLGVYAWRFYKPHPYYNRNNPPNP